MAIERRGGCRYYYQKHWINGHVVAEYVAGGQLADIAAGLEGLARAERDQARRQAAERRAAEDQLDRTLDDLQRTLRAVTRAVLLAEGFYLHKGQWRKRRERKQHQS